MNPYMGPVAQPLQQPLQRSIKRNPKRVTFNGSTQYLPLPNWAPTGAKWSVEFAMKADAASVGISDNIFAITNSVSANPIILIRSDAVTGNNLRVFVRNLAGTTLLDASGTAEPFDSEWHTVRMAVDGAGNVSLTIDGVEDISGTLSAAITWSEFDSVALAASTSTGTPSGHFPGQLRNVRFIDHSGIQAQYVVQGDGVNLHGTPNTTVSGTGDFTIRWEGIFSATGPNRIIGNSAALPNRLDVDSATPRFVFIDGSSNTANSVALSLVDGERYQGEMTVTGTSVAFKFNGVNVSNLTTHDGNGFSFTSVHRATTNYSPSGCVTANLVIQSGSDRYRWKMDETAAELAVSPVAANSGNTGSDYDITWQNLDTGTDVSWIANNTRHYRMDEGNGTSIIDQPTGNTGTLVNDPTWEHDY